MEALVQIMQTSIGPRGGVCFKTSTPRAPSEVASQTVQNEHGPQSLLLFGPRIVAPLDTESADPDVAAEKASDV